LAQALVSLTTEAQARQSRSAALILSDFKDSGQVFHDILTLLPIEPAKISLHRDENVAKPKT
jgi:hypothetical protein